MDLFFIEGRNPKSCAGKRNEAEPMGDRMIEKQELRGQFSEIQRKGENISSELKNDKNECIDAMVWIGQSYPKILCKMGPHRNPKYSSYSEYCYFSQKGKKSRCFVHEAELRGCCRKVPGIPKWVIPGKTLIFLVHRDVFKGDNPQKSKRNRACGSIFGYFILKRVEIIADRKVYEETSKGNIPWIQSVADDIKKDVIEQIKKMDLAVEKRIPRSMLKNEVVKVFKKRGNANFIEGIGKGTNVTYRSRSSQPLPDDEVEIKDPPQVLEQLIGELIQELIEMLLDPEGDYFFVPLSVSQIETDRYCSKRLNVGAIYLVDALTVTITNEFKKEIEKKKPSTIAAGEELFKKTVDKVKEDYRSKTVIPSSLTDKVEVRGELVLFNRINGAYPVFKKRPYASFRSPLRVDGKKLLCEILRWYKEEGNYVPKIPYCDEEDEWTISGFASRYWLSKEFAKRVLRNYKSTLQCMVNKMKIGHALVFDGVGEFTMTENGLQFISYE